MPTRQRTLKTLPGQANVVAFTSGYGDGAYPSFWGVDAAGDLCCLVTDFHILVESLEEQSTFLLAENLGGSLVHPDLARVGLRVRALPVNAHRPGLRLEMEGGDCSAVITTGPKEYRSDRLPYSVGGGIGSFDFWFDEPLEKDAALTLRYHVGVRAL